jgi:hypothetical protein
MPGEPDPLYVMARRALLDAPYAPRPHLDAVVLVGAQAIYMHTGDADLAVAEYTTDADLVLQPDAVADEPLLDEILRAGGFTPHEHPGRWLSTEGVYVDLMVPEALAGPGTRGARLGPHGKRAARRAKGLEAALVDRDMHTIKALDATDPREVLGRRSRSSSCRQDAQDRGTRGCSGPSARQGRARCASAAPCSVD